MSGRTGAIDASAGPRPRAGMAVATAATPAAWNIWRRLKGMEGSWSWRGEVEAAHGDRTAEGLCRVVEDAEPVAHEELPLVVEGERGTERDEGGSVRAVGEPCLPV